LKNYRYLKKYTKLKPMFKRKGSRFY